MREDISENTDVSVIMPTQVVLSEIDLTIMRYMLENNYISPRILVSINTLTDEIEVDNGCGGFKKVTRTTIDNSVKKLLSLGYINMGAKLGRTNRYFISSDGAVAYYKNNQLSDVEKEILVNAYGATRIKQDNCKNWNDLFEEVNQCENE